MGLNSFPWLAAPSPDGWPGDACTAAAANVAGAQNLRGFGISLKSQVRGWL